MKKTNLLLAVAAVLSATSCSDRELTEVQIPDSEKGLIQFSMSDAGGVMASSSMTRAGFTGGTSQNLKTQIVARISSTNGTSTYHTRTLMTADPDASAAGGSNWNSVSDVDYSGDEYRRFWDDAFGRAAKLSVYGIAIPNKIGQTNNGTTLENKLSKGSTNVSAVNTKWQSDTENNVIEWKVTSAVTTNGTTTGQNSTTLDEEDLCYTNNIQATTDGGNNGRLVWKEHNATTYPVYKWEDHTSSCNHDQYKHDFYPTMDDGQMIFKYDDDANHDGPGHFDHGHMIFKHALTRITVDLVGGDGFDYTNAASFTLQAQTTGCPASVDLLKMITNNKLNIQTGAWSTTSNDITTSDHTYMSCGSKSTGGSFAKDKTIYTLSAQVIPGYKVTDNVTNNNMMTFMIDGNNYYVTEDQIFDALNTTANTEAKEADGSKNVTVASDNSITFEQGKNYHFTIKIGKTKIQSLTCTLVDWVEVKGSFAATNAYITFNSLKTSVKDCDHFDIYRVLNVNNTVTDPSHTTFDGTSQYMTGYATNSDPVADKLSTEGTDAGVQKKTQGTSTTSTIWETTWFFDNNKSFYHFRTVNPGVTITKEESAGKGDYFTMYSGPIMDDYPSTGSPEYPTGVIDGDDTPKYNDYHWGAIFKTDASNLNYSLTDGYQSQLSGPVGPTQSTLNLTEQHMMSNVRVVLLTPINSDGTAPTDAVDLFNEASTAPRKVSEVKITNFAGDATVRMGNGMITPSTTYVSKKMTTPDATTEWSATKGEPDTDYCTSKTFQFNNTGQQYYATQAYTYRVVPQTLTRATGVGNKVGITIQTPDDNMYYVVQDLSTIKPSSVTGNALKGDHAKDSDGNYTAITRWYPGYIYTYYFVITKTGIQALTCTIVDWVKVEAEKIDITLEN